MKVIECPRDAMQGVEKFIPTEDKVRYINQLIKVGFDTIDFGSFVSPKAVPQMQDTAKVLEGLELHGSGTKLLAIVANLRGAKEAAVIGGIDYLGFPLSLSETFQLNNTNRSIAEAMQTVGEIQELCETAAMRMVVYLSMGFGNPYNEPYNPEIVAKFVEDLWSIGIQTISLADTIGVSDVNNIKYLFNTLIPDFPQVEFGAHLHSDPASAQSKIEAAYQAGCRRFDSALMGYGGCPFADDHLVGNIATEMLLGVLKEHHENLHIDQDAFSRALTMVPEIL